MKHKCICTNCEVEHIVENSKKIFDTERPCDSCSALKNTSKFKIGFVSSREIGGRNVKGHLRDTLKAIDKGYGKRSNISNSVNIGTGEL